MRERDTNLKKMLKESERKQEVFALEVSREDGPDVATDIATGIDVAYIGETAYVCAIRMDLASLSVMDIYTHEARCDFPYIPGFFFLREAQPIIGVLSQISSPGVVLIDGNGILHPRRYGLASYIGLKQDLTTIGVAKSLLLGTVGRKIANRAFIRDGKETLGCAIWLEARRKPLYVSIGHRVSLSTALSIVEKSSIRRSPEPLRLAHLCAQKMRREAHGGNA